MPALVRGRVVFPKVMIPDPQGQNPKEGRPFVVISRNEDIAKGTSIQAVGINERTQVITRRTSCSVAIRAERQNRAATEKHSFVYLGD